MGLGRSRDDCQKGRHAEDAILPLSFPHRADGALWQTEQRPPRRSLLRPVRPRVLLPPPPPLHAVLVCRESCFVYVCMSFVYGR